ncbi:DUF3298 and DUF4163 domain-containing protein [Bacillus atrophaeus]|uniref:DUF3298 and DUF4163 domain-containing protein n=1 Tax=Bacillus atrophaeus TaxID=1452 RepID=UPI001C63638B|nr:DUF3298 and DUF4163 domain-containing protein [Bacillus atrophaeus]MCY8520835.1 DUF3298 and DUF4163 domain-containing protein [Bacillus atrophaeus]MCY8527098.1 DUF3298 and DUF4163 domain-containing protein [Bacillus atrophaeus]MCY8932007.1 DUF3298 and DUF4163 domain-containing protein [Bacillus atrophaeus]MCY8941402.1 DUF3298 and DUF4163 domain-containing protein [Bacillus atrophaeus]MCY8946980.1 DUF3298 and DUF4163 domain-containing protein [Bacillus atrophaeus]
MNKCLKASAAVITVMLFMAMFAGGAGPSAQAAHAKKPSVTSHTYKNIKELTYPQVKNTGNASFEKKINQEFKNYIQASHQEYVKNKKDGEKQGYKTEYQTAFEVKYNNAGKLSIQTENYIYSGGAHGLTAVQSFNYDLQAGKRVTLNGVLNSKAKMDKTKDYLYHYIKNHDTLFDPNVKKKDIILTKDTPFYFTTEGIAIVFQQYELGPYAAGIRDVRVPYSVFQ